MRAPLWSTVVLAAACGGSSLPPGSVTGPAAAPTFADDVAFLAKHGPVHVLESPTGGRVALSAKYQGRVMTSAVEAGGRSCGWINRSFIASGRTGTPFDNFGGEDRFWLGPEGGQHGLYFPKGAPFAFDRWQVPHELQEGAWETREASPTRAVFARRMSVTSWSGTTFDVGVERTVRLLSTDDVRVALGVDAGVLAAPGVKMVAFESRNQITNAGAAPWTRAAGLASVWILAMYAPAEDGRVIVPFAKGGGGPIVNDAYFGKVPAERLVVKDGFLLFEVDGQQRGKIGLGPGRARPVLGSYSPGARLLTIVHYDLPPDAATRPYVNSMWELQKEPYGGDVVNSYNDGPPAPGKPALGGFYELETSSPGAELAPGESLVHTHRTMHFVGEEGELDAIARGALGVPLSAR